MDVEFHPDTHNLLECEGFFPIKWNNPNEVPVLIGFEMHISEIQDFQLEGIKSHTSLDVSKWAGELKYTVNFFIHNDYGEYTAAKYFALFLTLICGGVSEDPHTGNYIDAVHEAQNIDNDTYEYEEENRGAVHKLEGWY